MHFPNQNTSKSDRSSPNQKRSHPTKKPQKAIALSQPKAIALHQNISKSDRPLPSKARSHPTKTSQKAIALPTKTSQKAIALWT
jgi:hypothetical protein